MKKKFLAFGLAAAMVIGSAFSTLAATKDEEVYSSDEAYTLDGVIGTAKSVDNPLKGVETDKITIEYSLTSSQSLAAWLGAIQFYTPDGGVAHFAFWPKICLNNWAGKWANFSTGETIYADSLADGQAHVYKYVITSSSIEIYVDGVKSANTLIDGKSEDTITTDAEACAALFDFLTSAEKVSYGNGHSQEWWGELNDTSTINSLKISAQVEAEEEPSEEQPTSKDSPQGGNEETPTPKPDETPSSNPGEQDTSKDDNKPGEDETTVPSPNGGSEEAVKATVVTAEVAKAVAEAAKVTTADGKVLDVVLTATPVEDTTAVAGLIAADKALEAAKVKAFAVLDLELKIGDKKVTYLDNKVNVTIPMDKIFTDIKADETVAVYRVDKDMAFSFLGTAKVAADKTITFATDHFTQYVFAVVDDAEALKDVKIVEYKYVDPEAKPDTVVANIPVKANASVDNPDQNKTGDTTPVMPLVILAVVALGGVVAVVASKKRA